MALKKALFVLAVPPEEGEGVFGLAGELNKNDFQCDLFCPVELEQEELRNFPAAESLFNNVHFDLNLLAKDSAAYDLGIFDSIGLARIFSKKIKSISDMRTVLFSNIPGDKTGRDIPVDVISGDYKQILDLTGTGNIGREQLTSIVMLTFNQLELTKKCLDSLGKYTESDYELIIVDNGSSDGTVDFLKDYKKKNENVVTIFNSENVGFAKANNQGMEVARGDYILLLNNDVILTVGWLKRLITCAESIPAAGVVGPCTNVASGPQRVEPGYRDIKDLQKFAAGFYMKNIGSWREVHRLNAFCFLIKREVIDGAGMLDEMFGPGGYEDYDYCLRVQQAGYRVILAGDTYVHHIGGQGYGPNKLNYNDLRAVNRQLFIEKWCRRTLEIMEAVPD